VREFNVLLPLFLCVAEESFSLLQITLLDNTLAFSQYGVVVCAEINLSLSAPCRLVQSLTAHYLCSLLQKCQGGVV
jgi:hypothetical protein